MGRLPGALGQSAGRHQEHAQARLGLDRGRAGSAKMILGRRDFFAASLGAAVSASAQQPAAPPARTAKRTKLYQAPDLHPNALEASPRGLWIGDQVSERVFQVDWKTGKVLQEFQTEAHNTSGLAVGAGCLWISCNGGVSNRRPPRPNDKPI